MDMDMEKDMDLDNSMSISTGRKGSTSKFPDSLFKFFYYVI
jgi:hypothetical protein